MARLAFFERYLSVWVALCMAAGVAFGKLLPQAVQDLRSLEFGHGSQINIPIASLIWLMITPMMMKVDFGAIRNVGRKPKGLIVTLVVVPSDVHLWLAQQGAPASRPHNPARPLGPARTLLQHIEAVVR